ncbi:hypothetical protein ACFLXC_05185, partial [Chloroflexota bacterium]
MTTESSFSNPFTDYNANVMDSRKILDYWCNPFSKKASLSEENLFKDNMPIVFLGGRGSGKTMFLKYFSYSVQKDAALRSRKVDPARAIIPYLRSKGGIGFYLRFDGPLLRSFGGLGVGVSVFSHYFELQVCKAYIEVIADLVQRKELNEQLLVAGFIPEIARLLGKKDFKNVKDVKEFIEDSILEVTDFRAAVAFADVKFNPTKAFAPQDLSFRVPEIARDTIEELKDLNFVILLDEYENFDEHQQIMINTLMKFVKKGVTFRVGMRQEGFHTFDTTSPREFIKEGRDYSKHVFEEFLTRNEDYRSFLLDVARRRLASSPLLTSKNYLDIEGFLGVREDLEEEALKLVGKPTGVPKHFELLKSTATGILSVADARRAIARPDRPLVEMMNIVWLLRGKNLEETRLAMSEFIAGEKTQLSQKYRNDYTNKYKLSLMFLLISQYRKHKMYYSFNTFCFLSSGIVGNFIELCRRSFQYAIFNNREELLEKGRISADLQDRA